MNHHISTRRKLIAAAGAGTLTAPFALLAQSPPAPAGKVWRVGTLTLLGRPASFDKHFFTGGILQGLRDFGLV